jgi:peroxiredoxin
MRQLLFFLALSAFLIACGGESSSSSANKIRSGSTPAAENPDITIQLQGAPTGLAYLIGFYGDQRYRVDSAQVSPEGTMHFENNEPYQQGFMALVLPDDTNFQLLVSEDQTFTMKAQAGNITKTMEVEGSLDNQMLYKDLQMMQAQRPLLRQISEQMQGLPRDGEEFRKLRDQREKINAEREKALESHFQEYPNSFFTKFRKASKNPVIKDFFKPDGSLDQATQTYVYRTEMWDDIDFSDERLLYTPVIGNKLERYIKELTPQHPDSIVNSSIALVDRVEPYPEYFKFIVNWILINYEPLKTTLMDPQAVYVNLVERYITYDKAFWTDSVEIFSLQQRAYEMSASLVGKKAPDVVAKDPNGQTRSIGEIKSPYIVVYMYNPDCEHCAEESPKLVRFYREWKPKGVEVFGIALNTEDQEWKDYIKKQGMTWPNVYDPTNKAIYAKYFVDNTPEIYVINPDRTIIAKNLKVNQIAEVIERDMAR